SGHLPYCVRSLWSSPALGPKSLVIPRTRSAVSGHLPYMSAVSGHLLYYIRSLWSSPVLCPQSLVSSRSMSAVSGQLP
ncbi:unnamed protein product, partial [Staurois parvus]